MITASHCAATERIYRIALRTNIGNQCSPILSVSFINAIIFVSAICIINLILRFNVISHAHYVHIHLHKTLRSRMHAIHVKMSYIFTYVNHSQIVKN